ncbi:MAG: HAMP domain-containing protein [Desulfobulbaceae bacterium]|nr:HAMP domain-containing protein [Desulfobulbaceae bacterium]
MNFFKFDSISKKLALLTLLAVLPALGILFYSGLEQRRNSIESAKRDLLILTHTIAEAQKEMTNSARQILSTLSLLPAVQAKDSETCSKIFKGVLAQNPTYLNITLTDPDGEVLASARTATGTNLADLKHVREALESKKFAVGEYIVSGGDPMVPVFAFAYPVLDKNGRIEGVLTTGIDLTSYSHFYDFSTLPEKSFVSVSDHRGIRLFYYPAQRETNPVGKPIRAGNWEIASKAEGPEIFLGNGTDGERRIFAFEQIRLAPAERPYLYIWAAIPEATILAPANGAMARNLLLMLLVMTMALIISRVVGKKTLISPIKRLVGLTEKFGRGNLEARSKLVARPDELGTLTRAFHDMAEALTENQRTLRENEARFRLLMDSLDAFVYVADMNTYEVLFINKYAIKQVGDITGKICWQTIQKGQKGPCPFCTNKYLLDEQGKPGKVYTSESQNNVTGQWWHMNDRAIEWIDGRIVRLQVATDITERKKTEEERERLIAQLEEALAKIKTLSGFLPICSSCKMIRDDKGYWNQIESYIRDHSEAEFSHGICPECAKKLYPDFVDDTGQVKK